MQDEKIDSRGIRTKNTGRDGTASGDLIERLAIPHKER